jgi:hypothetical protein
VLLGAVAHVGGKIVLRVLLVQITHLPISVDLCKNRGGRNGDALFVTSNEGHSGPWQIDAVHVTIDDDLVEVRNLLQLLESRAESLAV